MLFVPNSQFKVTTVLQTQAEKEAMLDDLSAYDMTDLRVYVVDQL